MPDKASLPTSFAVSLMSIVCCKAFVVNNDRPPTSSITRWIR